MALLQVERLSVQIDTPRGPAQILHGVDFALDRGERLSLVGESGCGKSMTALAIMGLLPEAALASGRILFEGRDLLSADEATLCRLRGGRIAMVFQEPMTALNPVVSIGRQVAEGLRLHLRLTRRAAEARAAGLLDRVGLPPARFPLGLYPHQLSGGQRQRVVIAIALACGPTLLIADEPTTALDMTIQAQILDLVAQVAEDEGMALLMITHDLGIVAEIADRVLVMYAGQIAERGPTAEVFARMAHPYTRGLFAAMPQSEPLDRSRGRERAALRPRLTTIPGRVPDALERPAGCAFAPRCAYASEACRRDDPPPVAIGDGHTAACFHPVLDGAERPP
jgi:peptide/nickel transport system ATP-binding protein